MKLIDRIVLAWAILNRIDLIEESVKKVESLGDILERLEWAQKNMPTFGVLEALAERLDALNRVVVTIEETPSPTKLVAKTNGSKPEDVRDWERLKLLSKFVHLSGKSKDIEDEWRRIQQDEHDFEFAFKTSPTEESQSKYLYKKGIADGIKWCVNLFS